MRKYISSAEFGSLTTSQLMEKVRGLQNLAFQLGLDEGMFEPQYQHTNSPYWSQNLYNFFSFVLDSFSYSDTHTQNNNQTGLKN